MIQDRLGYYSFQHFAHSGLNLGAAVVDMNKFVGLGRRVGIIEQTISRSLCDLMTLPHISNGEICLFLLPNVIEKVRN